MASLFELSNELLDMIFAHLAREDFFALRSSCRGLHDASWNYCAKTYFSKLTVTVSPEGFRRYNKLRGHPRIKQAIRHLWLLLGSGEGWIWPNSANRALLSDLPNLTTLTLQHANPTPDVSWKKVAKVEWKKKHHAASGLVSDLFLNLLVTPNSLQSIDVRSSDFKDYVDGLLRLDDLDVMARAAPLLRHSLASLVTLSLSLNTHISEEPVPDCYDALPTLVKGIPTLEELTLVGTKRPFKPRPPLIFRALVDATTGDQRLPRLKRFRLKWFPVEQDYLVRVISSHIKTLRTLQMTHILLLHSVLPETESSSYAALHSTWLTFLMKLSEKEEVNWALSTFELMSGQPQRAQRVNMRLWETTPQRKDELNRVRKG